MINNIITNWKPVLYSSLQKKFWKITLMKLLYLTIAKTFWKFKKEVIGIKLMIIYRLCHRKTGEVIKIEISFRQLCSWDAVNFLTLFKVAIFQKKWHVLMMKIKKLVKHYILKRQEKGTRDIINNIFFKYWHTTSLFCTLKWDDDDITKLSTYYSLFY